MENSFRPFQSHVRWAEMTMSLTKLLICLGLGGLSIHFASAWPRDLPLISGLRNGAQESRPDIPISPITYRNRHNLGKVLGGGHLATTPHVLKEAASTS